MVPGSERVQLDSAILLRGIDYSVDYAAGVVYLLRAQKPGQSLTVSYRYDKTKTTPVGQQFQGITGFKFDIAPQGAFSMLIGMGLAERGTDGSVTTSNIFGWNNNLSFGGGALKGLYLLGQKQEQSNRSIFEAEGARAPTQGGQQKLILQNLQTKIGGGTIQADYQDISKNFSAFGSAAGAGYDQATLDQLQKEKGLTRMGLGMKDVKFGSLGLSNSFRTVQDGKSAIDWRSYGLKSGGLELGWSSRKIDKGFTRFKDLAEADRDQMLKEAGMSRENFSASFGSAASKISLSTNKIEELSSRNAVRHRDISLDTKQLKLDFGDQEVSSGFTRMGSLMADENAKYGKEIGLRRQWLSLQAALFGGTTQPIKFSQNIIDSAGGSFKSQDLGVSGKSWSLQHSVRDYSSGFSGFGPLNATAEGDAQIKDIANMYGPDTPVKVEGERQWLLRSAGVSHDFTRFAIVPLKGWNMNFDQLKLKGSKDSGELDTMQLSGKNFNLAVRQERLGAQFSEIANLLDVERQRLGAFAGLKRTDVTLSMALSAGRKLDFSSMSADTANGGARRNNLSYADKKLQFEVNSRQVDPGFTRVNQLVDPQKDLLGTMIGFKETDAKIKWDILPNLKLAAVYQNSSSDSLNRFSRMSDTQLSWNPNKQTELGFFRTEKHDDNPASLLFANVVQRMTLSENFGKYGTFHFLDESQKFDGTQTTQSDSRKQYFSYEAKLNDKTSFKTEQTRTKFDNGEKEDISANTISTNLTKNAGVSVTDVKVDRQGDQNDETKRNYGFWYDIGNGMRISYGYARQLSGETQGGLQSQLNITPGTTGNLKVDGGSYNVNQWDASQRTQANSKIALTTAKPMRLGFISNFQMNFGLDTAADYSKWIRENKALGFSGNVGSNTFGYQYNGQMFTNGFRAIDRSFKLATDQSDKRWLRATLFYKVRTMPDDSQVMIRDFNITAKPTKNLELTHQFITNPEVAKGDAILGSVPSAARSDKWKLDFKQGANFTFGGSWEELINDQNNARSRTGGINMTFFEKSGSPLKVFYGIEQAAGTNIIRRYASRYSVEFDQRAGPNQTFSIFAGNVSYEHSIADTFHRNNYTIRLDYQIRF